MSEKSIKERMAEYERVGNLPVLARTKRDHELVGSSINNPKMLAEPDKTELEVMTEEEVEAYIQKEISAIKELDEQIGNTDNKVLIDLRNRVAEGFNKNLAYIKEKNRLPKKYNDSEISLLQ